MGFEIEKMLNVLISGVGLASIWLWIYLLLARRFKQEDLKWWLLLIMPQGVIIAAALNANGVI